MRERSSVSRVQRSAAAAHSGWRSAVTPSSLLASHRSPATAIAATVAATVSRSVEGSTAALLLLLLLHRRHSRVRSASATVPGSGSAAAVPGRRGCAARLRVLHAVQVRVLERIDLFVRAKLPRSATANGDECVVSGSCM